MPVFVLLAVPSSVSVYGYLKVHGDQCKLFAESFVMCIC